MRRSAARPHDQGADLPPHLEDLPQPHGVLCGQHRKQVGAADPQVIQNARADAVPGAQQSRLLQPGQRVLQGRTSDPVPGGQLPLGGQQGSRFVRAAQNVVTQPRFKQVDHGSAQNAFDGHGGSPRLRSMVQRLTGLVAHWFSDFLV